MHIYSFSHHNHGNTTYISYVSKTQQWHIMGPFLCPKIELVFVNVRNIQSKASYTYFFKVLLNNAKKNSLAKTFLNKNTFPGHN
jgi:hypothetical protein